jgi:hypothetical protein
MTNIYAIYSDNSAYKRLPDEIIDYQLADNPDDAINASDYSTYSTSPMIYAKIVFERVIL